MTKLDLDAITEDLYLRAGISPDTLVSPLQLAGNLFGWQCVVEVPKLGTQVRIEGSMLAIDLGLPARCRGWHIARALARWELGPDATEAAIDSLGACLRTPRLAFEPLAVEHGASFSDLAYAFAISESAAALRFGEVTGTRVVLFAPGRPIRVRGHRGGSPRTIRLTDAPDRHVRLFAA